MNRPRARKKGGDGFDLACSVGFGLIVVAAVLLSGAVFAPGIVSAVVNVAGGAVSGAAPLLAFVVVLGAVPALGAGVALAWRLRP